MRFMPAAELLSEPWRREQVCIYLPALLVTRFDFEQSSTDDHLPWMDREQEAALQVANQRALDHFTARQRREVKKWPSIVCKAVLTAADPDREVPKLLKEQRTLCCELLPLTGALREVARTAQLNIPRAAAPRRKPAAKAAARAQPALQSAAQTPAVGGRKRTSRSAAFESSGSSTGSSSGSSSSGSSGTDDDSDSRGQPDAQQPTRCSTRVRRPKQFDDHVGFLNSDSSSGSSSSGSDDDEDGSQRASGHDDCVDHLPEAQDVAVLSASRAYRQRQGQLEARGAVWASRVTRSAAATATAKASSAQQTAAKKPQQRQQKRAKAGTGTQQQPPLQRRAPQQHLQQQQPASHSRKRTSEPSVQQSPQQVSKRMSTRASGRAGK